jgi:diaminopimelate epimerase
MKITFWKYQGNGNDFVIIDNRDGKLKRDMPVVWEKLCDRRFGIGADGLIMLENKKGYDFEMYYVNADGKPTSMCGNGGRCITHFAKSLGVIKNDTAHFLAIDGDHDATVKGDVVKLKMKDVNELEDNQTYFVLDTGSPHYVTQVSDVMHTDVVEEGRGIRNSAPFKKEGINVNFVEIRKSDTPLLRTYERGVENETLACGTGTVAAALVLAKKNKSTAKDYCDIQTMGGNLRVWFSAQKNGAFKDVWLEGPVSMVFKGEVEV